MGIAVDVVRVACKTSGAPTTQAITVDVGGLTPKAAIFLCSHVVTDDTAVNDAVLSYGATTGTSNQWVAPQIAEDNVGTTNTAAGTLDNGVVRIQSDVSTTDGLAAISSFGADTVTIDWSEYPASAYLITVIAFAGSDLSAHAGWHQMGNLAAVEDITAPGFEPDIVLTVASATNDGFLANIPLPYGLVHNDGAGGITQHYTGFTWRDNRATSEPAMRLEDSFGAARMNIANASILATGVFSDFDSSGFTVTVGTGNWARRMYYLALSFGGAVDSYVGSYSTPTSTGSDTDTGPNFTPQFVMLFQTLGEAFDTIYNDSRGGAFGISALVASEQQSYSINSEDNVGTTNTQSLVDNTAILLPDDDGAALLEASLTSFGATGPVYNFSAVDAAAKIFLVLAIEAEAAAAVGGSLDTPRIHPRRNALLRM